MRKIALSPETTIRAGRILEQKIQSGKEGMKKQGALTKLARIYGAQPDFYNIGGTYQDFVDINAPAYQHYLNVKAQEKPTSKWTAGLTGGAIGGGIGVLADIGARTPGIFTGILGGLGALAGLSAQSYDEKRIEDAKRILASKDISSEVKLALIKDYSLKELSARNESDRQSQRAANRHTVYQTFLR